MATGACGIDCTVCRLHVQGLCSTCGAGTSTAGREKLAAQHRLFGQGCAVLQCACDRGLGHCLRDCDEFPCGSLSEAPATGAPYPFSAGFLEMQARRRAALGRSAQAAWPETAPTYWEALAAREPMAVYQTSGATPEHTGDDGEAPSAATPVYALQSLQERWRVDVGARTITKLQGGFGGEWDRQVPFLWLVYLAGASAAPRADEMVAPRELYPGLDAFQGRHALPTGELEAAFGHDPEALARAAERLGAQPAVGGDLAYRFAVLPKVPLDVLLWRADDEFPARVTLLLDRHTPRHLPADACALLVSLCCRRLLLAARAP